MYAHQVLQKKKKKKKTRLKIRPKMHLEQNEKCGVGKLQIMQIDKNGKLAKLFRVQSYTKCKFDKGHSSHQTDQVDKIDKTDLGDQTHRVEQTIPIEYNTRPMVLHCLTV